MAQLKQWSATFKEGHHVALSLAELIRPQCERIEIAGSLRRKAPWVGDIEIVCAPLFGADPLSLFGDGQVSLLHPRLDELLASGTIQEDPERKCWGEKHRHFLFMGAPIDLFIVTGPAHWGVIYAIRTGNAEFSKKLVTPKSAGGYLQMGQQVESGQLIDRGQVVPCPEEEDFFRAIGAPLLPPEARR